MLMLVLLRTTTPCSRTQHSTFDTNVPVRSSLQYNSSSTSRTTHHAPLSVQPSFTHQCAEKYKAKVFPRIISSPQTLPDLSKNSVPMSSDMHLGLQGKSLPSGSSPTIERPSVVMTDPLGSKITRDGIPLTLNLVLSDDFLSLYAGVGLDWFGLDWIGLGGIGLDWTGLD